LFFKDYQKYQAKVLKLQEREKTPQNQAKLDAVMSFAFSTKTEVNFLFFSAAQKVNHCKLENRREHSDCFLFAQV